MTPRLSRRGFLGATAAGALALTGCGTGFALQSGDGTGSTEGRLSFTMWAGESELAAFRTVADRWTASSGMPVVFNVVPFSEALTGVDATWPATAGPTCSG